MRSAPWRSADNNYTLTGPELVQYAAGSPLQVQAVHRDGFGHKTTLTAQLINTAPDQPSRITGLTLAGPGEFATGAVYQAHFAQLTDPNGRGQIQYKWYVRGNPSKEFQAVVRATTAQYTLQQTDFAETLRNEIKVALLHHDPTGGTTRWTRTREHQPAARPTVQLHAESLQPDGVLRLQEGVRLPDHTRYQWQRAETLGQFENIPGATLTQYNITRTPRPAYVRMLVTLADSWGVTAAVTTRPITINRPPQGLLWLENNQPDTTTGITIRAVTLGIKDPNGGRFQEYLWKVNGTVHQTTAQPIWSVPARLIPAVAAGTPVALAARYEDALGWAATITTARKFNTSTALAVKIHGPTVFAPGNVYTAVLQTAAAPGMPESATLEMSVNYQWGFEATEIRRAPDIAGKVIVKKVVQPFAPIQGATDDVYTMRAPELAGQRKLRVLVQQNTAPGLMIGTQDSLVGSNTPITGRAEVEIINVRVGGVATVRGTLADNNGLVATLWAWESAAEPTFRTPRQLPQARGARYTLQPGELRNESYLRARLGGTDSTGATTWITTAPQRINYPPTGQLKLHTAPAPNHQITFFADFSGVTDRNGPLQIVRQRWMSSESTITLLLSGYVVTDRAAAVRYVAEVEDALGFSATLTGTAAAPGVPRAIQKIVPALALETARNAQSALNRHLDKPQNARASRWEINEIALRQLEDLSQLVSTGNNKFQSGRAEWAAPQSPWTFWGDKSQQRLAGDTHDWTFAGQQELWLVAGDRQQGKHRWGLALGQERIKLKTTQRGANPEQLTQELNLVLPYWEYQLNNYWRVRGMLGYGAGKIKFTDHERKHRAALAWQMAGLQTTYETPAASPLDLRLGLGVNATRSKTGEFTAPAQKLPGINAAYAYEVHGTWENGYQLTLAGGSLLRPFWTATGRTQWGAAREALIIHGGGGLDWEFTPAALAGRFHWDRQLTENKVRVRNNYTLGLEKKFTRNKYLTWTGQLTPTHSWTQSANFKYETNWQTATLIRELNFNDDLSLNGRLILQF